MNVEKMRLIGQDILAEPRRFNMLEWLAKIVTPFDAMLKGHSIKNRPPCGTAVCYAGAWALRELGVDPGEASLEKWGYEPAEACADDLDLPNQRLFFTQRWPRRLEFEDNAGTKAYAKYFVNVVLEDYIKTNGWEGEWEGEW